MPDPLASKQRSAVRPADWDEDFYPDENGHLRKRIILKVSDFRSALVQGKLLAKKGLWISEFRIESGLNCGGHAFPTEGLLLGPILEEFKTKLLDEYHAIDASDLELYKLVDSVDEAFEYIQQAVKTH